MNGTVRSYHGICDKADGYFHKPIQYNYKLSPVNIQVFSEIFIKFHEKSSFSAQKNCPENLGAVYQASCNYNYSSRFFAAIRTAAEARITIEAPTMPLSPVFGESTAVAELPVFDFVVVAVVEVVDKINSERET